ncbi:MAG: ABC transporter ATP-binding protein [bacterium]
MSEKILEIQNLTAGYGEKAVIKEVSFTVERGELVILLGPNASGKSTLLKAILRINQVFQGKVLFKGEDVFSIPRRKLAQKIAYLPQENGQEFSFSLEEVVMMGRFPHSPFFYDTALDKEKTESALRAVGLWEKRKEKFSSLSGGEKRRAVIARALAQESELLLLDEPTLHLDLNYQLEVSALLRKLAELGRSVLAVYHDLWLASLFAHRVLTMKSGLLLSQELPLQAELDFWSQLYDLNLDLIPKENFEHRVRFLW